METIVKAFPSCQIDIGVISPYRSQVSLLRQKLQKNNVDVNTVDQFQGKDKHLIIYSCTRSKLLNNDQADKDVTDILADLRRLNVAMTRAKAKICIIGNRPCLQSRYKIFNKLFEFFSPENIIDVSK